MEVALDGYDQTVLLQKNAFIYDPVVMWGWLKSHEIPISGGVNIQKNQLFSGTRFWLISMWLIMIINQQGYPLVN